MAVTLDAPGGPVRHFRVSEALGVALHMAGRIGRIGRSADSPEGRLIASERSRNAGRRRARRRHPPDPAADSSDSSMAFRGIRWHSVACGPGRSGMRPLCFFRTS